MFKNNFLTALIFTLSLSFKLHAQSISITEVCDFSNLIKESSGICTINGGKSFWVLNDSDNDPDIFEIDSTCTILRTVKVENTGKKDWEEITSDDQGNIFIGDFGNNDNNRKDLAIYKIKYSDLMSMDKVKAEILHIKYLQQTEFPPDDSHKNFDMEAMVWLDGKLHLFSKNRTNPFSGFTYHYSLSDAPGDYILSPLDSFNTGPGPYILFWVTAAAISPDGQKLVLLSHDKLWLFSPLNQDHFFDSPVKNISLAHFSQKEGICFGIHNNVFICDEMNKTLNNGGKLYTTNLDQILSTFSNNRLIEKSLIYAHEFLELDLSPIDLIEIFDTQGKKFISKENLTSGHLNIEHLFTGLYYVMIKSGREIKNLLLYKN